MRVTVKLIGPFVQTCGFGEKELDLPRGATAADLTAQVAPGRTRPWIVTRNSQALAPGEALAEGDRVVIAPVYSGG